MSCIFHTSQSYITMNYSYLKLSKYGSVYYKPLFYCISLNKRKSFWRILFSVSKFWTVFEETNETIYTTVWVKPTNWLFDRPIKKHFMRSKSTWLFHMSNLHLSMIERVVDKTTLLRRDVDVLFKVCWYWHEIHQQTLTK